MVDTASVCFYVALCTGSSDPRFTLIRTGLVHTLRWSSFTKPHRSLVEHFLLFADQRTPLVDQFPVRPSITSVRTVSFADTRNCPVECEECFGYLADQPELQTFRTVFYYCFIITVVLVA